MKRKLPDLKYEKELWKKGFIVIGIDEVGRGAFAGPLYVGGVVFEPTTSEQRIANLLSYGINDSKKLTVSRRNVLSEVIQKECLSYHISQVSVATINRFGVGRATFMAMRDVVKNLRENISGQKIFVLVDGFYIKHLKTVGIKNQKGIVRGDEISLTIAAASIIAKVARDKHMVKLSAKYPNFQLHKNKGYGTAEHRTALQKFGATKLHRTAFIKNFI